MMFVNGFVASKTVRLKPACFTTEFSYYSFLRANNKGTDQAVWMPELVCFVVCIKINRFSHSVCSS